MAKLNLKVKKIKHIIDGEVDYEEVIPMRCVTCGYEEEADADIVFECWEMSEEPIPIFLCPECDHYTMIPVQVIEETDAAEAKEAKKKKKSSPR